MLLFFFLCVKTLTVYTQRGKNSKCLETTSLCFILRSVCLFQLLASDGVQQSNPVSVTITVLDANDNTPTFTNVSYSVNLFTDMMPGETVLQVRPALQVRKLI